LADRFAGLKSLGIPHKNFVRVPSLESLTAASGFDKKVRLE